MIFLKLVHLSGAIHKIIIKEVKMERLQKVIAASGVASRRKAEELIRAGRVSVNGLVVKELGTKVSGNDEIAVDGVTVSVVSGVFRVQSRSGRDGCDRGFAPEYR